METFTDFIFFLINRVSDPDVIRFNLSAFTSVAEKSHETHVGPQVIHVYELGNRGPSEILKTDVYILWPTKTLSGIHFFSLIDKIILGYSFNHWSIFPILKLIKTMILNVLFLHSFTGKDLLYLVDLPIIDGPADCQAIDQFNPLALKVNYPS